MKFKPYILKFFSAFHGIEILRKSIVGYGCFKKAFAMHKYKNSEKQLTIVIHDSTNMHTEITYTPRML